MVNHIKTMLLMIILTVILMIAGELLLGEGGMMIAFLIALGINFFAFWYSDKVAITMTRSCPLQVNEAASHMFIVNPLSAKGLSGLFSTHPPIQERVKRLRNMNR